MQKGIKVQGWDLALTHSASVELTDGEMTRFWYLTNQKTSYKKGEQGQISELLDVKKIKDKQQMHMERLLLFRQWITSIATFMPDYVGIEDYALKADNYAHLKGEIGGTARMCCSDNNIKFRLHDPLSIKMFVSHHGHAGKGDVEEAVKDRWGVDFSEYNKSEKDRTTSGDLCDAYAIAKLVWYELLLRNGEMDLKDLHEKEIQVFNRVTKSYPVNLLGRDWIE